MLCNTNFPIFSPFSYGLNNKPCFSQSLLTFMVFYQMLEHQAQRVILQNNEFTSPMPTPIGGIDKRSMTHGKCQWSSMSTCTFYIWHNYVANLASYFLLTTHLCCSLSFMYYRLLVFVEVKWIRRKRLPSLYLCVRALCVSVVYASTTLEHVSPIFLQLGV